MTDYEAMTDWTAPIRTQGPEPLDGPQLVERLRLTALSLRYVVAAAPALALAVLSIIAIVTGPLGIGVLLALMVVPGTQLLTDAHRRISGLLLDQHIPSAYAGTDDLALLARPFRWCRDRERWKDFAFLWFSATGGLVLAALPAILLTGPVTYAVFLVIDTSRVWLTLFVLGVPLLLVWWVATPALLRTRALADRRILGPSRLAHLRARVDEVEESRSETLDLSAAEVKRIERDLHDGAQARIASVGMTVGLAEKLIRTDPDAAEALLREARESTVDALEDLRRVVRGILPPVLADQGLAAAVEALAVGLPVPVTVIFAVPRLRAPVESAAYFAIAECLANTVKHAGAQRALVRGSHDGECLHLAVGDDGCGGADPAGSGLAGIATRLAAFDGTVHIDSPEGGPTSITMEVPCRP